MINHPNRRKKRPIAAVVTAKPAQPPLKIKLTRKRAHNHEAEYPIFEALVRATFDQRADTQLFQTAADPDALWSAYIGLMPSHQQIHLCHACRRFIQKYGGLAIIQSGGMQLSAMWEPISVPEFYRPSVNALSDMVKRANVTGPFYSSDRKWGEPKTGPWTHLSVIPYPGMLHNRKDISAEQLMASKVHDFQTVTRALVEWTPALLDEAIRFLKSDSLHRSEMFIKPAVWLRSLYDRPKGKYGTNVLWSEIAHAPDGFCHPRSGMLGTLLDDLAAGKSFTQIKAGFDWKMGPLAYMRPQAVAAGNIEAAEKLVDKLGLAPSLERRFARLDEVRKVWTPRDLTNLATLRGGVFAHLKAPDPPKADLPAQTMTWVKFASKVLPRADKIEMQVPTHGDFIAMATAVHADAPPILQWDHEDDRYPVSQYRYNNGSLAHQWGLRGGAFYAVTAIAPMPGFKDGQVMCILDGAKDSAARELALFPEILKSNLHGIRSTIEAHSKSGKLSGYAEASACGLLPVNNQLRVFADGAWGTYRIDRWD